jgi:hypothetical protein
LILIFSTTLLFLNSFAGSGATPYAKVGSYAYYDAEGGFIPFFDGVQANVTYSIEQLFPNGSMLIQLNASEAQGNEVPVTQSLYNYTDTIEDPKIFPAVPLSALSSGTLFFENATCIFSKNTSVTVPAGTFDTIEFTTTNASGAKSFFWFDKNTGLVIEMAGQGSAFELVSSNIASPLSQPSGVSTSIPFEEVFVATLGGGVLLFVGAWIYLNRKNRRKAPVPPPRKAGGKNRIYRGFYFVG